MQVIATGSVTANAVSLDATSITIIAQPVPKTSAMTVSGPLALTTNNLLVILVKFSDSPVADPFTRAQVDAVVRTNTNSVASYYNEVSYNKEQLNVTVTPWLRDEERATPASCDFHDHRQRWPIRRDDGRQLTTGRIRTASTSFPVRSRCGWAGVGIRQLRRGMEQRLQSAFRLRARARAQLRIAARGVVRLRQRDASVSGLTGCSASEYGDPFVVMGNKSAGHFDALQKTLIERAFRAMDCRDRVLRPTHQAPLPTPSVRSNPLESRPTPSKSRPPQSNRTYWIEYRQPVGLFDNFHLRGEQRLACPRFEPLRSGSSSGPGATTRRSST